jgi:predicted thioredoxin/glutaredoxin
LRLPAAAQVASCTLGTRMQVDLVTRAGCHLCDEALAELRALGIEPRLRDVDGDPVLFTQFDFRVPVVLVEGRVVGEGRIDRTALALTLER